MMRKSIAVIGGGIAGLYAASRFDRLGHQVELFEQADRLGGHTDTHMVQTADGEIPIDTGFIVCCREHYPLFTDMLDELGVATQPSNMSFSVHHQQARGYEYAAGRRGGLFSQRSNLLTPRFWRMLSDIVRFYRLTGRMGSKLDASITLADFLAAQGFSNTYIRWHILPMAAALWSCSLKQAGRIPLAFIIDFMRTHQMLQLRNRPHWETIQGGSHSYIKALCRSWSVQVNLSSAVSQVRRSANGAELLVNGERLTYDAVVMACHSDQALSILSDASPEEQQVLGAIRYADNEMVLHTDTSLLPVSPRAWASWNVRIPADEDKDCKVSYWMNLLQSIPGPVQYITSLNQTDSIDPEKIILRRHYAHPVFDVEARAAVQRWQEINGQRHTWYCGAYWGWGFHEDGVSSAAKVVQSAQKQWKSEAWAKAS